MEKDSCTRERCEQSKDINVQKNVTDDRMMRIRATQGQLTTTGRGGGTHTQTGRGTHTGTYRERESTSPMSLLKV